MTRFWITLEQGVRFVLRAIEQMAGGEVFVPKIPSMGLADLVSAMAPGCVTESIGIRPGEKLHEVLVSEDEARNSLELDDMFVIQPMHPWWSKTHWTGASPLPAHFRYTSNDNPEWLSAEDLHRLIGETNDGQSTTGD